MRNKEKHHARRRLASEIKTQLVIINNETREGCFCCAT